MCLTNTNCPNGGLMGHTKVQNFGAAEVHKKFFGVAVDEIPTVM